MASTREERQQMRQRGAATRKTKEINFGFSFGGPSLGFPEPTQPAIIPETTIHPQTEPASIASTLPPQEASSQPQSQTDNIQRTPGSARNSRPPRISAYDIPPDGAPEQIRSNKRRKITNSSKIQPGHAKAPTEASQQETADNVPVLPSPPAPEIQEPERAEEAGTSTVNGKEIEASTPDLALNRSRPSKSKSPQIEAEVQPNEPSSRKSRQIKSPIQTDQETADNQPEQVPRKSISPRTKRGKQPKSNVQETPSDSAEAPETSHTPTANSTAGLDASDVAANGKQTRIKATGKKTAKEAAAQINGNRSKSPSTEGTAPDTASENQDQQAQPSNIAKGKRPRRNFSPAKDSNNTETEPQPQSPVASASTAGEPSTTGARQTRKPAKRKKTQSEPETNPEVDEEPEAESAKSKSRKTRSGGKSKRAHEQQAEPEAQDEEASQEPEQAMEPEPPKQRRRQGKNANQRTRTEASPTEEPSEAEAEAEAEESRPTQRKSREPRGETVPVTIHRLVNTSALGTFDISANDPGEEGDRPTDESSTQQKTKLPNRGGVNPADVLSQICRETLEKTLTTLKTGIENETNAARRAEWSRKRKAVENFGMELDGRLLDLSEMLDSNFVLGVQLKKAKRDMMELRSHLHQVRRERESIALQMDQVRSRHMQKENEKTTRSTINNSIHSLELALDRNQYRGSPSTEPSSTELEFLLRSVAEEVSCRAPGSQGGLLHQIRSFNAQLESTARQLERS
ncbi:hypothetical protein N7533_007484 [Penicillium manginii]|uniref:uncharacterized protein n=1 Tax=Penicillium manginii TaxID=203109 RepID=UPI00254793C7|nr:uncharacterized protein N7533_007484 [Penicillium manginii]KAJ5750456.1 hypothetical protein N7533_007484 [Penicillium manginii]